MPLWANSSEPSPANSVVFLKSPRPHHGMGHTVIPNRSVELHRVVRSLVRLPPLTYRRNESCETHRS